MRKLKHRHTNMIALVDCSGWYANTGQISSHMAMPLCSYQGSMQPCFDAGAIQDANTCAIRCFINRLSPYLAPRLNRGVGYLDVVCTMDVHTWMGSESPSADMRCDLLYVVQASGVHLRTCDQHDATRKQQMPACKALIYPNSTGFQGGPQEHDQPKQNVICSEPTNHRTDCSSKCFRNSRGNNA